MKGREYFRLKKYQNWHRMATYGAGAMWGQVIEAGDITAVQIASKVPKPACVACGLSDNKPRREKTVLREASSRVKVG